MTTPAGRIGAPDRLAGKTALVTGAAGAIGTAVVHRLSAAGVNLLVCGRDRDRLEHLANQTGALPFVADLTDAGACRSAVAAAEHRFGRLDLVHLGVGTRGDCRDIAEFELSAYRRVVAANVDSVVFSLEASVPALRRAGGGAITVSSSLAGVTGYGQFPLYSMTKAAVNGLVRATSQRLARSNIYLAALCPSFVDKPLLGDFRSHLEQKGIPLLAPAEVADALVQRLCAPPGDEPIWTLQPGHPPVPHPCPAISPPAPIHGRPLGGRSGADRR
ncbi:SDR family oxidoreductase [Amycolatopsis sp. NPDC058278]|uniref:SDR family oxidoreductase n=1 Tax=Amycolatopsis sp. NPDC058278 TaxID=3346417 RepID=UPI0036D890A7